MWKIYFLFSVLFSFSAVAQGDFVEALRVECLPEMQEFRTEVLDVSRERLLANPSLLKDNGLYYWEQSGLEKKAFEMPINYAVFCMIDGVRYLMDFYDMALYDDYTHGVVLKADGVYIGDMNPLGTTRDYSYDLFGVRNNLVFVQGIGSWEKQRYHSYEVPVSQNGKSYQFNAIGKEFEKFQKANVAAFLCYPDLGYVGVRFYTFNDDVKLLGDYAWLKDNPQFQCGDIMVLIEADKSVQFKKNGEVFGKFKLDEEDCRFFDLTYQEDTDEIWGKCFDINEHWYYEKRGNL